MEKALKVINSSKNLTKYIFLKKKTSVPKTSSYPYRSLKKDINFETYLRTSNPQVGAKPQDPKSLMGMMKLCCVLP